MIAMLALIACTLGPGPMTGHSLVYSAHHKAVLMIGGDDTGNVPIYQLGTKGWTAVPGSELPIRSLAAMASDDQGNVLMHGGSIATPKGTGQKDYKLTPDTWLWNGKAWRKLASTGPEPRDHHAMAYDSARKRFVLFGGSDADPSGRSVFYGDTWEWEGSAWKLMTKNGPPLRCHHAMAYDPIRKQTLLMGGFGPRGADDRMWGWDGKEWKVLAKTPLAERSAPCIAWDGTRTLLFGGDRQDVSPADTWAWDGATWTQVAKAGPPGRTVHGMAFDFNRGAMVVFGGSAGNDVLGDTWEFAKGAWKKRAE